MIRLSAIVDKLDKNVDAKRRGLTYVIELNAWSQDARKAARIANAFAESYLADQLAVKSEATSRASKWLNERVDEMRDAPFHSERALEQYKSRSQPVRSGERRKAFRAARSRSSTIS